MSLMKDFDIIQGDTGDYSHLFSTDEAEVFDANWSCKMVIKKEFTDDTALTERELPININLTDKDGIPLIDSKYFVLRMKPTDTETIPVGYYKLIIELNNAELEYNRELVQCIVNITPQGIKK